MHAETLLLLLDELDELQILAREMVSPGGMAVAAAGLIALWVMLRTASPVIGACLCLAVLAAISLVRHVYEGLRPVHTPGSHHRKTI